MEKNDFERLVIPYCKKWRKKWRKKRRQKWRKNDVKNNVKNGVKNDVKNWDSFLRHFLRQESVVLSSDIEKVCVHVVNNGTEYLCVVPNLYSHQKNIVDSLYLIEYTLIESVN